MRKLLFVALVIVTVGCVPAPTRMVVIGDSHAVPADAWSSAVDCMAVDNRSIGGAGLGTSVYSPALVNRLDSALSGVGSGDLVMVALGSNDFGSRTVAQMKAEGIEYEERMELLSDVTHPKPLAELLDQLVLGEEEHLDWIETQLHAIGDIGIERYLQSQLDA